MTTTARLEGILVVESGDQYQIVGAVISRAEAIELARNYTSSAVGREDTGDFVPPETFVINRRGPDGWYTVREELTEEELS